MDVDAADLHQRKRALKLLMRQWERDFEEANGGLVATHEDKKLDARYAALKQQGKELEHQSRKSLRKSGPPPDPGGKLAMAGVLYAPDSRHATDSHGGGVFTFVDGQISLSTYHIALLVLLCGVPYALFIAGFSLFGFGALVFDYLVSKSEYFIPLIATAAALLVVLYIFDVSYWSRPIAIVSRRLLLSVAAAIVMLGGALSSREYPYAPLLLYMYLAPGYFWLLKRRLLHTWPLPDFLRALATALALLSSGAALMWVLWVLSYGNHWNVPNKRRWMLQMGGDCCADLAALPQRLYDGGYPGASVMLGAPNTSAVLSHLNLTAARSTSSMWDGLRWPTASSRVRLVRVHAPILGDDVGYTGGDETDGLLYGAAVDETGCLVLPTSPCLSVFLFWVSPFVTAAAGVVGAFLCLVLYRTVRADKLQQAGVSVGARVFIVGLLTAAGSLWVSASIAGASMGVSKVILLGFATMIIVLAVLLDRLFGWKAMLQVIVTKEPMARRIVRFCLTSDWSRSAAMAVGLPLLLLLVMLSVANQFVRVHVLQTVVLPAERALVTTKLVDGLLRRMSKWEWCSVLRKVIVLCVAYLVLSIGVMKIVTVFMSWLVAAVETMHLAISISVFYAVGLSMFLNPACPGAPVYMASGVLVTAAARASVGYWGAIFLAMFIAFTIKLIACAIQQVIIGGRLRRSVRVRAAVGVNTPIMRAITVMMSEPGISRGKVAMLCGGPDWPTSVGMGLLGMRLSPMLLGTTPIIVLIAPLTLSGAFMLQGPTPPYRALTHIMLALSSLTQLGAGLLVLHYVERTTHTKREELERLPYDEEVLKLNQEEEEYAALYAELICWTSSHVPRSMRLLLVVGALSGIIACQAATLLSSRCFEDFTIADPDFDTQLRANLRGNLLNLVKPFGWAVCALSLTCYLCRYAFVRWAAKLVDERYRSGQRAHASTTRQSTRARSRRAADGRAADARTTAAQTASSAPTTAPLAAPKPEAANESKGGGGGGGGRKLVAKSKPFWELQQEREARRKHAAVEAVHEHEAESHRGLGVEKPPLSTQPSKERPPRQHRHRDSRASRSELEC